MMYSYKLNNSYTVYVNHFYLSNYQKPNQRNLRKGSAKTSTHIKQTVFTPLPVNTRLFHKTFGCGKVMATNNNGMMTVAFEDRIEVFIYPDALKYGFLYRAEYAPI